MRKVKAPSSAITTTRRDNTLNVLEGVSKLICAPEYWTVNHDAVTRSGEPCKPTSDNAYAFCLAGAISRTANALDLLDSEHRAYTFLHGACRGFVQEFNDTRSHNDVLDAVQTAKQHALTANWTLEGVN